MVGIDRLVPRNLSLNPQRKTLFRLAHRQKFHFLIVLQWIISLCCFCAFPSFWPQPVPAFLGMCSLWQCAAFFCAMASQVLAPRWNYTTMTHCRILTIWWTRGSRMRKDILNCKAKKAKLPTLIQNWMFITWGKPKQLLNAFSIGFTGLQWWEHPLPEEILHCGQQNIPKPFVHLLKPNLHRSRTNILRLVRSQRKLLTRAPLIWLAAFLVKAVTASTDTDWYMMRWWMEQEVQ